MASLTPSLRISSRAFDTAAFSSAQPFASILSNASFSNSKYASVSYCADILLLAAKKSSTAASSFIW